jgi:hypothetical protein
MADDANAVTRVPELTILTPDHSVAGDVVKWRRRGDTWEALMTHEVDGKIVTEWLPALKLTPEDEP